MNDIPKEILKKAKETWGAIYFQQLIDEAVRAERRRCADIARFTGLALVEDRTPVQVGNAIWKRIMEPEQ